MPRSRYTGLPPLNAARMRLRHVEEMLAQHEAWLALPLGERRTMQRP